MTHLEEKLTRAENEPVELTEDEILDLIDSGARTGLGISGTEYLQQYRDRTIARTGGNGYLSYLASLAWLLED